MRVLITGGAGLLGRHLIRSAPPGWEVDATQRQTPVVGAPAHTLELADVAATESLLLRLRPELVIHTAYSTAQPERDILSATRSVVKGCLASGARLIYMSTDALLDGESGPYGEEAEPRPVHAYGEWKARAELHVRQGFPEAAVIRTSLVTEFEPLDPRSAWVADSLRAGSRITLFTDEIRCPIAPADLARQIWEIAAMRPEQQQGIWNLAGPEALSRYSIGLLVAGHEGLDPSGLTPALSASAQDPRPRDLRLLTGRADRFLATRARPISSLLLKSKGEETR
jgi:dTDP-4-dehydrorhamnose reductase